MEQRSYQVDSIKETITGINNDDDVLIKLPTGTGKTIIYSPIAVAAANSDYRVCISCYTKYMQNKILSDIKKFPGGEQAITVMGDSNYICLKTGVPVDGWFCEEHYDECIKEGVACDKILKNDAFKNNKLIITNHAKFVTSGTSKWDLVILDDSHSFENVLEDAYHRRVLYRSLQYLYNNVEKDEVLGDFVGIFLDYFDVIYESDIPTDYYQGTISTDNIVNIAKEIITDDNIAEIKDKIDTLQPNRKEIAKNLFYFIGFAKRASFYRFYLRKDYYDRNNKELSELIATDVPQNVSRRIKRKFEESKVIFATATPGPENIHANTCTKRDYNNSGLKSVPSVLDSVIKNWFNKLDIYSITNIGDTRDRSKMHEALDITLEIFKENQFKSILLFKNYNDQKLAYDKLSKSVKDLYFIEQDSDQDEIQELANRSQIILASASTRLWEGIDIQKLDLGIIYTPPFIRVPVHIPKEREYSYNSRIMFRRLQQGIGRLIRNTDDKGLCLLMDANFKRYTKQNQFSQLLKERMKEIDKDQILNVISNYRISG